MRKTSAGLFGDTDRIATAPFAKENTTPEFQQEPSRAPGRKSQAGV